MTDEQKRRINDHRPAVGLQWDENNPPPRVPFDRPEQWTILLTSGNHGLVGSYGHTFPHAEGDHERINVVDEAVVIKLRKRIRELDAAGNTNKAVLTDEQIGKLGDEILSLHRQLAAEKLRADQGWERAKAKSKECIELRERLPAPAPADNPSTAGAGNERALFESWAQGRVTSLIQGKFGTGYV
ncbi:hypothetical protein, partial [Massilia sp. TN1-12]|uniref:hypothetical protein n=1 Tax=Massilia paldalensis TaxID=3377675 RepID=UPI00384F073B